MNWKSLHTRLTVYSALVIFLAATISAAGTVWHAWREQVEHLDDSLKRQARTIQNLLAHSASFEQAKAVILLEPSVESDVRSLRVWDHQGALILTAGSHKYHRGTPPGADGFQTITQNERHIRLGTFTTAGYRIEVGADLAHINETIIDLLPVYSIVLPLLLLLTLGGGSWLAGRALRPIAQLAEEAETITATELNRRLPIATADEIGRLAQVLNAMLARLRVSFEQSRRFSADASHELKTPITILRGQLEAALYSAKSPAALQESLLGSLEEVDRLARIIDGLLLLSRSDAGQFEIELQPLDFSRFMRGLLDDAEVLASTKELQIEAEIAPALWVAGHEIYLRQIVLNLLDNACKYNWPRGRLKVTAQALGERIVLTIANTGPGIAPQQSSRLFERFYRGDAARGRSVDGLGLGLAIAREIARGHGADIRLMASDESWTSFTLSLPAMAAPLP